MHQFIGSLYLDQQAEGNCYRFLYTVIHLCKCIPALFSVPPQYSFIVPIQQYPFGQLCSLVLKRVEIFVLRTWDRIGPRICTTGAESKAACITQGINKDCPPTCWFVSLGFTNRVSKDHRGKVENTTEPVSTLVWECFYPWNSALNLFQQASTRYPHKFKPG